MSAQTREPLPRLAYGVNEAAASLDLSRRSLYGLIEAGMLRTIKIGGRRLVPADELRRLCAGREAA